MLGLVRGAAGRCLRPAWRHHTSPAVARRLISQDVMKQLEAIVGAKNISAAGAVREQHARDESAHPLARPDVVVFPESTEQVSNICKTCYSNDIPMVAFGAGSGLEGGVQALKGGVCIDVTHMDKVLEVHNNDFDVVVQPGVTWRNLNMHIRDTGLWFPIDPGADASLGGMCATSASGTNAVRYGTMRENVTNLEVVLPNGTVIYTAGKGRRTKKTSAGYNLTNLFVGSEGTLGIITQATLRLHSTPDVVMAATCSFPTVMAAIDTTVQILQSNIPMARIEFLDDVAVKACNTYSKTSFAELSTLFLEFNGTDAAVKEQVELAMEIAQGNGSSNFQWAKEIEDRNKLWKARHAIFYATCALKPNTRCYVTDVCVPISNLSDLVASAKEDIISSKVIGTVLGHVGDGNFHSMMLFDPNKPEERENVYAVATRMALRALELGGSCTGEHGIGIGKQKLLVEEIGAEGVEIMKTLKKTLDPKNLMNPGKVFMPD
ncbi:probable D-lactate dehydrogenase, mitochondrial isoform X2 [Ornithodoros turicata]